jgi:hypothetical protein
LRRPRGGSASSAAANSSIEAPNPVQRAVFQAVVVVVTDERPHNRRNANGDEHDAHKDVFSGHLLHRSARLCRRDRFVDKRYIDEAVGATYAVAPPGTRRNPITAVGRALFRTCSAMIVGIGSTGTVVFAATEGLAALKVRGGASRPRRR